MPGKRLLLALTGAMAAALATGAAAQDEKIKIGFLPGVVDPFYQVMQLGVNTAAKDLGIEVVTQVPPTWGVEAQTPILDALVARGDLDYIITAPTDKDQMVAPLQAALDAGIKVITVDTFLGDGDYANGPVTFPISYIGSDNVEGGRISARGLAKAIGGKGKVYINSTNPNVCSVEGREQGFAEVMKNEFPDIKVHRARLQPRRPEQGGAADRRGARAGPRPRRRVRHQRVQRPGRRQGGGQCRPRRPRAGRRLRRDAEAIELMNKGVVTLVLAQKPFDMGYMAVQFAAADAAGVTSLPRRVETGFAIIDKDNVTDPEFARFIYKVPASTAAAAGGAARRRAPRRFEQPDRPRDATPRHGRRREPTPRPQALHPAAQPALGVGVPRR